MGMYVGFPIKEGLLEGLFVLWCVALRLVTIKVERHFSADFKVHLLTNFV
jgi:hypothetical protein